DGKFYSPTPIPDQEVLRASQAYPGRRDGRRGRDSRRGPKRVNRPAGGPEEIGPAVWERGRQLGRTSWGAECAPERAGTGGKMQNCILPALDWPASNFEV